LTGICLADKIRSAGELTEAWLEYMDLMAQVAPMTRAAIRPPAYAIDRLRSELGVEPTDELREGFGLHDGAGYDRYRARTALIKRPDLPRVGYPRSGCTPTRSWLLGSAGWTSRVRRAAYE
jgi:hypothetical protein